MQSESSNAQALPVSIPRPEAVGLQRVRTVIQIIVLLGAMVMMYIGQLGIFRGNPAEDELGGFTLMAVGLILAIVVVRNIFLTQPDLTAPVEVSDLEPVNIKIGWFLISLALTAYVTWRSIQRPPEAYFGEYVIVWGASMLTLALAFLPGRGHASKVPDERPFLRWEYAALFLLLLGALAVRGIALGSVPYLLDQDEAALAREGAAWAYIYHFQMSPFAQGVNSFENAFQLLIGVSTEIFGKTLFAARFPSMIFGSLTIPAVYLLGRELFNRKVGLIAALFMLGWAFDAQFSRLALNQAGDPLFTTLSFYFLVRGLRRGTVINYFMSGLTLCLAQFFYVGARIAPLVMIAYLIYLLLRQRRLILRQWRLIGVLVMTAFIATIPQNFWIIYFQQPFSTRFEYKSIFSGRFQDASQHGQATQFILDQIHRSLGSLFTTADASGWYGSGSNLMGPIGGPLLLLGFIGVLLVFWKRPRWILPLGWIAAVTIGGEFIEISPPAYERYFPAVSAFALLVGAGVWYLTLGAARFIRKPALPNQLIPILGALILIGNTAFYVFDYIPARLYFPSYQNQLTNRVAAEMVNAEQQGRYVVVVAGFSTALLNTVVIQYYMAGDKYTYIDDIPLVQGLATTDPNQSIDYSKPLTFIIAKARFADIAALQGYFPNGRLRKFILPEDGSVAYYIYAVDLAQF